MSPQKKQPIIKKVSFNDLCGNDFVKKLMKELASIFEKYKVFKEMSSDSDIKKLIPFKSKLNQLENYTTNVFASMSKVLESCEQLERILVYISHFPKLSKYKKAKITKAEYIQYHLENYYIKIAGLLDRATALVNEVFLLGIPSKRCKIELVYENTHVKGTEVGKHLRLLNTAFQKIKEVRNFIIHRGIFDDKKLKELQMFSFVMMHSNKADVLRESYVDIEYNLYLKEKINELSEIRDLTFISLNNFFTAINPAYLEKKKNLANIL